LPVFHVFVGRQDHWFVSRAELDEFLKAQEAATGGELSVDDAPASQTGGAHGAGGQHGASGAVGAGGESAGNGEPPSRVRITELHEVRTINACLKDLGEMGFNVQSLIRQQRTGVEKPRYVLRRGESEIALEDLRGLLAAVRSAGERGLQVTRFKGLGEMNAEELRDTTLDPANRTLVQVTMRDAAAAVEIFSVLMGDKVEPRREFIEKHALEVRNLDV
jgi:DNA gyrase subunit B